VPPDLTPTGAIAQWSEKDFIQTMRRGITLEGHVLSARYMPWRKYGAMSDNELGAIYKFLVRDPPGSLRVASVSIRGHAEDRSATRPGSVE
jgi:hypothetical protein